MHFLGPKRRSILFATILNLTSTLLIDPCRTPYNAAAVTLHAVSRISRSPVGEIQSLKFEFVKQQHRATDMDVKLERC